MKRREGLKSDVVEGGREGGIWRRGEEKERRGEAERGTRG